MLPRGAPHRGSALRRRTLQVHHAHMARRALTERLKLRLAPGSWELLLELGTAKVQEIWARDVEVAVDAIQLFRGGYLQLLHLQMTRLHDRALMPRFVRTGAWRGYEAYGLDELFRCHAQSH
jgi:hypothetical protein